MSRGTLGPDPEFVRLYWSLGVALPRHIVALRGVNLESVLRRSKPLLTARVLRRICYDGRVYLYATGPAVGDVSPDLASGWMPPPAHYAHAIASADLIAAFVARAHPAIRAWEGEAELRTWVGRGEAIPDGSLTWSCGARCGQLQLETDRGTEPEQVWRAKLLRYRNLWPEEAVLAAAPSRGRARRIADLAFQKGVRLYAGVQEELVSAPDPMVFDAVTHRRTRLRAALCGCPPPD